MTPEDKIIVRCVRKQIAKLKKEIARHEKKIARNEEKMVEIMLRQLKSEVNILGNLDAHRKCVLNDLAFDPTNEKYIGHAQNLIEIEKENNRYDPLNWIGFKH